MQELKPTPPTLLEASAVIYIYVHSSKLKHVLSSGCFQKHLKTSHGNKGMNFRPENSRRFILLYS
jgi:hypothetical protein